MPSVLRALTSQALPSFMMALLAMSASAQITSSVDGRTSDTSDGAIAGATVLVTNEATGVSRSTTTSADGYYHVPDLLPGKYTVRAEQQGFKTLIRSGIELNARAALNLDLVLQIGDTKESVEVSADTPLVETTDARISQVIRTEQIQSLPAIGRGLMWLTTTVPGIQGRSEDGRAGQCCDAFSSLASPSLSSGGSEVKAAFFVDGVAMHYGDGNGWNLAFTPNLDAVEEMRVSTNPTSADEGILSGVQVQMVTKGGSNSLHGTAHYTFLEDGFNALPYGASKDDVGSWYQRYFGGTVGGSIIRDRLFFFGAYEGLREKRAAAGGSNVIVETEAFKNWVTQTRPNSVAAQLMATAPPFKYATDNLVDVNGDGIMDIGTISVDRPSDRKGDQFNGRVDYQTKSAKDRLYGTYWRNRPVQQILDARPELDYAQKTGADMVSAVNAHIFSPSMLNELRFSVLLGPNWDWRFAKNRYDVPCVQTDDGLSFPSTFSGACSYSYEVQEVRTYDFRDTLSWDRGSQSWKFGASYRRVYLTDPAYLFGDTPAYNFASVLNFANDAPYIETRNVDASTGKQRNPFVEAKNSQLSFFANNTWRVRPGLTVNLGLRWDYYANFPVAGIQEPRNTYAPIFKTDQVNASGVLEFRNQPVTQSFNRDLNNFGPRVSAAWDPTKKGRMAIRGGFFVLYDEINSLGLFRNFYGNPPISSLLNAGPQYGIPVVYGLAPQGTRDFPINPGLVGPAIDPNLGVFVGTRPNLVGYATDFRQPMVYDANAAIERQLMNNLSVTASYHYRHTSNDVFSFDSNRFPGDLANGLLDRLNPYYGSITTFINAGVRTYHGLVFAVNKRLSNGWQLNASYNYHSSWSNGGGTEAFNRDIDWARDETSRHGLKVNGLWELPFFRNREGFTRALLAGWQLSAIGNFEAGGYFNPVSTAAYGSGGDFNADGNRSDRPDLPAGDVSRSFSKDQWMKGALTASMFPNPDTIRNGTLPRNYFRGPGYARVDMSFAKKFRVTEQSAFQFQVQASNLLNRVNISAASNSLRSSTFGMATGFYPMRAVQMTLKFMF